MNRHEHLNKIPFFNDIQSRDGLENMLDSLTKVISRRFIVEYCNNLIKNNVPFSLNLIDLDNFKLINDNYGHSVGDEALALFAEALNDYVGDTGIVGRFGGDEFVIISTRSISYDEVHDYLQKLMNSKRVARRYYKLACAFSYVTASIGSAAFPADGNAYDEIFNKADKALYRGKTKGRNCFIIYLDSKHKNIDISKIAKEPEFITFKNVEKTINSDKNVEGRITEAFDYVANALRNSGVYFFNTDKKLVYKNSDAPEFPNELTKVDLEDILKVNDLLHTNNFDVLLAKDPELHDICKENHVNAILMTSVKFGNEKLGYLVFTENKIKRMWQDDEIGLLVYVSTVLAIALKSN